MLYVRFLFLMKLLEETSRNLYIYIYIYKKGREKINRAYIILDSAWLTYPNKVSFIET